jgi:hypothetical protein
MRCSYVLENEAVMEAEKSGRFFAGVQDEMYACSGPAAFRALRHCLRGGFEVRAFEEKYRYG